MSLSFVRLLSVANEMSAAAATVNSKPLTRKDLDDWADRIRAAAAEIMQDGLTRR